MVILEIICTTFLILQMGKQMSRGVKMFGEGNTTS